MIRITTLVSASIVAIALVATLGSLSAADKFATLDGVKAVPMSSSELDAVAGTSIHFFTPAFDQVGTQRTGEPPVGHKFHHTGRDGIDRCGDNVCLTQAVSYNGLVTAAAKSSGLSFDRP